MSMMATPNLSTFIGGIGELLRDGGILAFTITHPCFWPSYWGYNRTDWYSYEKEQAIEAEFRISQAQTGLVTTHFHRPISSYVTCLIGAGLYLTGMDEPLPRNEDMERYPETWEFPRFLVGRAEKAAQSFRH
jgi:hypothetical protein